MAKIVKEIFPCRVCGFDHGGPVWDDEMPLYLICPSCRAESGPDDYDLKTVRESRKGWIDGGMKWWSDFKDPPENWDPEEQMKQIPPEWL